MTDELIDPTESRDSLPGTDLACTDLPEEGAAGPPQWRGTRVVKRPGRRMKRPANRRREVQAFIARVAADPEQEVRALLATVAHARP